MKKQLGGRWQPRNSQVSTLLEIQVNIVALARALEVSEAEFQPFLRFKVAACGDAAAVDCNHRVSTLLEIQDIVFSMSDKASSNIRVSTLLEIQDCMKKIPTNITTTIRFNPS